jgi:hypothetical protein
MGLPALTPCPAKKKKNLGRPRKSGGNSTLHLSTHTPLARLPPQMSNLPALTADFIPLIASGASAAADAQPVLQVVELTQARAARWAG